MRHKLPKMTGHHALVSNPGNRFNFLRTSSSRFRVDVCTANLGATNFRCGHAHLKHCFAKIIAADGKVIKTLAFGRSGVSAEPYPATASTQCAIQAINLSYSQAREFISAFRHQNNQTYQWGHHDCCTVLNKAVDVGLNSSPCYQTSLAASNLERSQEIG